MEKNINILYAISVLLILSGMGVFLASSKNVYVVKVAHAETIVENNISVKADTSNEALNGADGINGQDGLDGIDGADGISDTKPGNAKASVKVVNVVDGNEVTAADIDIQTSGLANSEIVEHQIITSDDGSNRQVVALAVSNETEQQDNLDGTEPIASAQPRNPLIGMLSSLFSSLANFLSSLFNIF